jgi:UDP-N-acetylglucosamine 1-carboxyvinyltransferase
MSIFIIKGQRPLRGEIKVGGAKNAALKIIPAAILSDEPLVISNLPDIEDTKRSLEVFASLGGEIQLHGDQATLQLKTISKQSLDPHLANKFRASIMFVGPLLARTGEVVFPHPGGCVIGAGTRPIDLFLEGYKCLGAEVSIEDDGYHLKAQRLQGNTYFFTKISVTGTESLMMTAVLAEGTTVLKNCACEPEIFELANHLNRCGAKISGAGTSTITIEGVKKIQGGNFDIMPDRIETGTFAILAAAARSPLSITHCCPDHIEILLTIFKQMGIGFTRGEDWLSINSFPKELPAYSIKTHEYPGFPTDLQSPFTVLMTQAHGSSLIHETIYDRRLLFTDMLTQMGANITMCDPHRVVIQGPTELHGKSLTSPDLRAGISMIIAGIIAQGTTKIDNIYQIERGYQDIEKRLQSIGVDIERAD